MRDRTPSRSALRVAHLKARRPTTTRLANVKIPVELGKAIGELAQKLGASKYQVTIALVNEGLALAAPALKALHAGKGGGSAAKGRRKK